MPSSQERKDRRARHAREVEDSQDKLRENIKETNRLLVESDQMLKRHRGECEAADD
jgi:hypothetical protein